MDAEFKNPHDKRCNSDINADCSNNFKGYIWRKQAEIPA